MLLRLLLFLSLFALPFCRPVEAQVVLTTYSVPTVLTVTVGANRCTFWFHTSAAPGYDAEVACWDGSAAPPIVEVFSGVFTIFEQLNFPGGEISWQIIPQTLGTKVILGGQGPTDPSPIQVFNKTL